MIWSNIFSRILKVTHTSKLLDRQEESKDTLWKLYNQSDSISFRAVILEKILRLRLKYFEREIAKSEQYPHEIDWDSFGSEMFDLLAVADELLATIITKSDTMQDLLSKNYMRELRELEKYKEQINA